MKYDELQDKVLALEAQLKDIDSSLKGMVTSTGAIASQSDIALSIATLNEYTHTLTSAMRLAKRCGLPEEFHNAVTEIQRILRLINMLKIAYLALAAARVAAGDPLAIAQAGIAIGGVIVQTMAMT